jgi:hypothetical protein
MRAHFGGDLIYGHIVEKGRHMIISAGLGTSNVPVRFMRPPEVVQLTLGGGTAPSQPEPKYLCASIAHEVSRGTFRGA